MVRQDLPTQILLKTAGSSRSSTDLAGAHTGFTEKMIPRGGGRGETPLFVNGMDVGTLVQHIRETDFSFLSFKQETDSVG